MLNVATLYLFLTIFAVIHSRFLQCHSNFIFTVDRQYISREVSVSLCIYMCVVIARSVYWLDHGLDVRGVLFRFPAEAGFYFYNCSDSVWDPPLPVSYSRGTERFFPVGKAARDVILASKLRLMWRLRKSGIIPLLCTFAFILCIGKTLPLCLMKLPVAQNVYSCIVG